MNQSNTLCPMPWMALSLESSGEIRPCCISASLKGENGRNLSINDYTLKESMHLPVIEDLRQAMLRGERPPECFRCWENEDMGVKSLRQNALERDYHRDEFFDEVKLRRLDLRLSNKCNLKCIMCSPASSDQIGMEAGHDNPLHENEVFDQFVEVAPYLSELYFAGGESMLHEEHFKMIEYLVEKGYSYKIRLKYSTNGTTYRKRWLEMMQYFRKVFLHISIDGVGDRASFIRHPTKWEVVDRNINWLRENKPDSMVFRTDCVLHNMSVAGIPDLLRWNMSKDLRTEFIRLNNPAHLKSYILPQSAKPEIVERLQAVKDENNLFSPAWIDGICTILQQEPTPEEVETFRTYIKYIEMKRGLKLVDYCPEFKDWF